MYADDAVIYYASDSTKDIMNCINYDLNIHLHAMSWLWPILSNQN